jgi:hypothetical protein
LIFFDAGKIYRFSAGSRGSCRRSNNSISNASSKVSHDAAICITLVLPLKTPLFMLIIKD